MYTYISSNKSEVLPLGSAAQRRVYTGESQLPVAGEKLNVIESLRSLGVQIDAGLTMDKQVTAICISCNYHIRALRLIRRHLPSNVANIVACSLVGPRLDYCNALLYGISQSNMTKLQCIQNTVARNTMEAPRRTHAVDLPKELHWLSVTYRVEFKIATFVYKSMSPKQPKYLSELLHQKECSRLTRSADQQLLQVPRSRTEIFTRAFQIRAPTIWNIIPRSLRLQPSLSSFKQGLKHTILTLLIATELEVGASGSLDVRAPYKYVYLLT